MSVLDYYIERDLEIAEQLEEDLEGTLLCIAYGVGVAGDRRFFIQRRRELRKIYRPLLKRFHGGDIGRAANELLEAYRRFEEDLKRCSTTEQLRAEAIDILYSHIIFPFPEDFPDEFEEDE